MVRAARRSAAGLGLVIALAAACADASAASTYRYPPAFERSFLASCNASSGGMTTMCRCALRWIERRYTYRQFVSMYLHDATRMRRIMVRAAYACRR
jgi:hypothetical protein